MAGELRSATFSISIDGQEKGSSIVAITRDLKGLVGVEESLNKTSATNVTVTKSQTTTQKEANAVARAAISDYNKQQKAIKYVTDQIEQETKMLMMSADEQQIFNAQMRAGVQPLSDAGLKIESLIKRQQRLEASTGRAVGSFRGLRGQMQNISWQAQDIAVQMQMGTDAMVIFSQQGSQLASGFGRKGALVGAFIAVGGAISGVVLKAITGKESLKELAAMQKVVNTVFEEGAKDATELTTKYEELFNKNRALALLSAQEAKSTAEKIKKDSLLKLEETVKANLDATNRINNASSATVSDGGKAKLMEDLAESIFVTVEQLEKINELASGGFTEQAASEYAKIISTSQGATEDVRKMGLQFATSSQQVSELTQQIIDLNKIQSGEIDVGVSPTQFDASLGQLEQSETKKHIQIMAALYAKRRELKYDDYEGQYKLDKLFEAEDKRMYQLRLDGIKEQQEIALAEYTLAEKIAKQQFDISAKNTAGLEAAFARQKQLKIDRLISENNFQSDMNAILSLDAEGDINAEFEQNQREAIISLNQIRATALSDVENDIISKQEAQERDEQATEAHNIRMVELEREKTQALKLLHFETVANNIAMGSALASSMSGIVDLYATGGEAIKSQMEEMTGAQKAMFVITQAFAAADSVVSGYTQAANWAKSGLPAYAVEPLQQASIAGGYIRAGAVMGVTVAGAFDKGGVIPSGQAGIVSEYGDELVGGTMVFNNSSSGLPVTGREDTARLLDNASGESSGGTVIKQYITVSGNGDQALTAAMKAAAKQGAVEGYKMVSTDLKNNRGVSKYVARSK